MKEQEAGEQASAMNRRDFIKIGAGAGAAALTAANAPAALAQAGKQPGSIDLHSHWVPTPYYKAISQLRPSFPASSNPMEYDLDKRKDWMDSRGVQMVLLTLSGGMPWQWVSPKDGARLAQIINDAAVEAHIKYPTRFLGAVEMSIRDPKLSLQELNRMAGKPGMRAVHLPNSMENDDFLFRPEYEPLLARCEELGYPLVFHPLDGEANFYGGKDRLGGTLGLSANIENTLGFPFESATTAAKFIITGTLDKYPKLEIVLPHSGGCFPYIAGRVERGLTAMKFPLKHPFREYVRRFHYDSLAFYPETLRFMVDLLGSDRIVIGTDNYARMDMDRPNSLVEEIKLAPKDRDRILSGNASRLLHV